MKYFNKRSKWISVEDRLPDTDDDVLVSFKGWDNLDFIRTLTYDPEDKTWVDWNGLDYYTVTHWMYLPKLPKQR